MSAAPVYIEQGYEGAMLANSQHEAYAQARVAGYSQSESARRANYPKASAHNAGCRLEKRPDIIQRMRELSVTVQPNALMSKPWVLTEVSEVHRLAKSSEQYAVSKACLELIARLQGYLVERRESYSESRRVYTASPEITSALSGHLKQLPEAERLKLQAESPEIIEVLAESDNAGDKEPG